MNVAFLVIIDRASDEELTAAHEVIKKRADGWWHHFANAWIVGGGESASAWRDSLREVLRTESSSLLVIDLPGTAQRNWAYFGVDAKKRMEWFRKNYYSSSPG